VSPAQPAWSAISRSAAQRPLKAAAPDPERVWFDAAEVTLRHCMISSTRVRLPGLPGRGPLGRSQARCVSSRDRTQAANAPIASTTVSKAEGVEDVEGVLCPGPGRAQANSGCRHVRMAELALRLAWLLYQCPVEMNAFTQLVAGVPVSDLAASIDWYTRFFGRPPDLRVGDEVLWDIDEHATLFIEPNVERAGAGRITFAVAGLDAFLERLDAEGIEYEAIETYSNGVRHVKVPDPDGNAIAFAEPPDAG
jgi:catechol 2,3-dioxygenase-like lactoylglutathione lyase family enzyme